MNQQLVELERIHFARVFPWVYLFRAFRLALDIRKMLLGALALLVLAGGLAAFSYLPLDLTEGEIWSLRQSPWELEPLVTSTGVEPANIAALLGRPLLVIWRPALELVDTPMNWSGAAIRWTQILWALCVWSFFGTAISRMVSVHFAVDQRISLKEAVVFAGSKWLWVISAPLMPLAGVLGLWFGLAVCGWIGLIPGAGPLLLGVFWIIPLLLALAIVLLLIGLLPGWPLMVATIATQGSDAFDGFSRSFDYVYSRFWHLIWFLIVAIIHGALMLAVVVGVVKLLSFLAVAGAGVNGSIEGTFAERGIAGWSSALSLLVAGYAVSYFWSASTIIYFLLRQSEDANHLSEVYLPKTDQSDDVVQLAGVADSDQPVIERPAKHEPETSKSETHD